MTSIIKVDQIQDNAGADIFNATGTNITIGRTSGVVKLAKIPMLKCGLSAAQNVTTAGRVVFNSLSTSNSFNAEDNMSALNTATGVYTIPDGCAGLWHISCHIYATNNNPNQIAVNVNGARQDAIGTDNGDSPFNQGAITKRFAAGDQVAMHLYNTGTSAVQSNIYHTWWQMNFLG